MAQMPAPPHDPPLLTALEGKRVLATGGARAPGAALAPTPAGQGAHLVGADRDGAAADAPAREINGEAWETDFLDTAALESPRLEVDVLTNNAGVQTIAPIQDLEPASFRRILTRVLEVPLLPARAALPHMHRQGYGRINNISSIHGLRASEFQSDCVAAKPGPEGFSQATAREGGPHGVTSHCVNPGYVRTAMVTGASCGLEGGWNA